MKEVDKKDAPEVSGGQGWPYVTDPSTLPDPDYPTTPESPAGELDLPVVRNR